MAAKQNRTFAMGEKLVVKKKSRLYDKDRQQEAPAGSPPLPPIDVDVTGVVGSVCGDTYHNPQRDEHMVPLRLDNDAVIAVPENRLERERPSTPSKAVAVDGGGVGGVSPDTIEFWRGYFEKEEKAKRLDKKEKKG